MCEILLYLHKPSYSNGLLNKSMSTNRHLFALHSRLPNCVTHSGKLFNYKNGLI